MFDTADRVTNRWEMEAESRRAAAQRDAKAMLEQLRPFVSSMDGDRSDGFATAVANLHPTLIGQLAKYVAWGVMRRTARDPEWKSFTAIAGRCPLPKRPIRLIMGQTIDMPDHPDHDGRLDCETVIGAELVSRQSFI